MSDFTVRDAVAWLGLTWEQYSDMCLATTGCHGGPQVSAVLAVRTEEQRAAETPAAVLAQFGIDPMDPVAAARDYATRRGETTD